MYIENVKLQTKKDPIESKLEGISKQNKIS